MRELPFGNAEFDAVVSSYAIDHLRRAERPKAIAEIARVLKPGYVVWVSRELRTLPRYRDWSLGDGKNPSWLSRDDQAEWDAAHPDVVKLEQVPHPQAAIFTANLDDAMRAAYALDFGGVLVNEVPTYRADQQPYGGVRDSGNTREGPLWAVREMTEERVVIISLPG